jgi:curved DNA-binding protein CbpA
MTRSAFDPYAVLAVARDASASEVARAHRRLAKQSHPDLHPGPEAAARMQRINRAWRILSDPARRARYDQAHPPIAVAGHWSASRAGGGASRTVAWSVTAAQATTASYGNTIIRPAYPSGPPGRRPARLNPEPQGFRDSGWAALLAGAVMLFVALAAIYAGSP